MPECPEQWKLDVNDRYQRAVGVVTSLSTGLIVLPVLFLKETGVASPGAPGSVARALDAHVYASWFLLAVSILGAIVYYFASAKWTKQAWGKEADMFGKKVTKDQVERILDLSYFSMMAGFVGGFAAILIFVATHV